MKLWLLMSHFGLGGLERVQTSLAPAFAVKGLRPCLVARNFPPEAEPLLPYDIPLLELAKQGRMSFICGLYSQLRVHRPSVVMTSANDVACLMLIVRSLFFPGMKVICTQHLSISGPLNRSHGFKRFKLWATKRILASLLPEADAIIAVSHAVADDMRSTLRLRVEIDVIHNPVVFPEFHRRIAETIKWPWSDYSEPTIVFAGRLAPEKRIDLLLNSFKRVLAQIPARLLILGEGPESDYLQRFILENDLSRIIRVVGFQPNPLPWIKASDLLVLSSDYEGFGMVLVEAMACGTQVVSTDCPDGPAEILENGRYGQLVPTDDVQELAQAIVSVLGGRQVPAQDLLQRANEFDLETAASAYLSVIQRVIET